MRFIIGLAFMAVSGLAHAQLAVVGACGGATYSAGQSKPGTQTTTGNQCVDATGGGGGTSNVNITQVGGNAVTTTLPVSAASLPLPTGASTSALQSNVQSAAGTPNATAVTVQGNASGVAVKTDGSGVTQPVIGTVTANAGTGNFVAVQATGANLHTVVDSGSVSQTFSTGAPVQVGVSCATSNTTLLAASTATFPPIIRNESSNTNEVWVNLAGATATAAVPNIRLLPGQEIDTAALGFTVTSQMNCIAVTGATTLTLIYK